MSKLSKYDDRIYFCTKTQKFIHLKWDHSVDGISKWWWTNFSDKHGYISGKLKTPKSWVKMCAFPEGTMDFLRRKGFKNAKP